MEGFFGEVWFGTQPLEAVRKNKGEEKIRRELEEKEKSLAEVSQELLNSQQEVTRLED